MSLVAPASQPYDQRALSRRPVGRTLLTRLASIRVPVDVSLLASQQGIGLNHMPSGRFAANGACLAVQVIAHNLARWTARLGLGARIVTATTLRRRLSALGRAAHRLGWKAHAPAAGALAIGDRLDDGPRAAPRDPLLT
jgi:hypothetical protein